MGQDTTTLFSGTFERSMDAKKRVAVPAPWLSNGEGEAFHVIPHPSEGYLIVMPPAEFVQTEQKFEASSLPPDKKRKAIRQFYGAARLVATDSQGRILLSEEHCTKANLSGDIVFVGSRSRFEIWNADRYAQTSAEDSTIYQEAANSIGL